MFGLLANREKSSIIDTHNNKHRIQFQRKHRRHQSDELEVFTTSSNTSQVQLKPFCISAKSPASNVTASSGFSSGMTVTLPFKM